MHPSLQPAVPHMMSTVAARRTRLLNVTTPRCRWQSDESKKAHPFASWTSGGARRSSCLSGHRPPLFTAGGDRNRLEAPGVDRSAQWITDSLRASSPLPTASAPRLSVRTSRPKPVDGGTFRRRPAYYVQVAPTSQSSIRDPMRGVPRGPRPPSNRQIVRNHRARPRPLARRMVGGITPVPLSAKPPPVRRPRMTTVSGSTSAAPTFTTVRSTIPASLTAS